MVDKVTPFKDRNAEIWAQLQKYMEERKAGSGSVIMTFTPKIAARILSELNTRNRSQKPGMIKRFRQDMADDKWLTNGEAVKFTDRKRLGDGQNRFAACVLAQKPFTTHVVFGIPDDYFHSLDQGRNRGPMDVLELYGVPKGKGGVFAAAVRYAELLQTGRVKQRTVFSAPDILELYIHKHGDVRDFEIEARAILRTAGQPIGMVMALLREFSLKDDALTAELADCWGSGSYPPKFLPFKQMQQSISEILLKQKGRMHEVERLAMMVNAWNLLRSGKTKGPIRWNLDKPFPKIA